MSSSSRPTGTNSLESLIYSRGSLEVVDQLELPSTLVYVSVQSCQDAFNVIRSMQVRGAPLIAIVAALGLAVDLHKRQENKEFAESDHAALDDFLEASMRHLRDARPTAVNLFQAMDAMSDLIGKVNLERSNGSADSKVQGVAYKIEKIIQLAEDMLVKDLETNKAMGDHGARRILELTGRDKIRVLTICNTGSLATSGYGTALGVVRSLHAMGKLEHIYACETRPYNQGARLTAFEIVQDNLPGTLITDSMASALMALKGVDCVIVGADRVAANGDTANKIGTYQLAITAKYHSVPFFTAVPTTTLDLSMSNGSLIHIEERPKAELTTIFGRSIAPTGIGVWNPSFDVTPSSLITGIITELGVVEHNPSSAGSAASFIDMKAFMQQAGRPTVSSVEPASISPGFRRLTESSVAEYVMEVSKLRNSLKAGSPSEIDVKEVGDGNLNYVYIVSNKSDPNMSIIVKQALPYIRCVGESWPLTLERATFENSALLEERRHCPEHVPEVLHFDKKLALIAMRYIEPPHIIMRKALIARQRLPFVADHLSTFLANTLFSTSYLNMDGGDFRAAVSRWSKNNSMCALTEKVIFTDPYMDAPTNRWTPQLNHFVKSIRSDVPLKLAAERLKIKFLSSSEALLHGDLHTGSVMTSETSTFVIDPEFAFYGPIGFDIGAILSNIFLSYFSQGQYDRELSEEYSEWILQLIESLHAQFCTKFRSLWSSKGKKSSGEIYRSSVYTATEEAAAAQDAFMAQLWLDSLGFAGIKMIRRIVGIAHVADLDSIDDAQVRSFCEGKALRMARKLVIYSSSSGAVNSASGSSDRLTDIKDVTSLARSIFLSEIDLGNWC